MAGLEELSAEVVLPPPLLFAHGADPSDACIRAPPAELAAKIATAAATPALTPWVAAVIGAVVAMTSASAFATEEVCVDDTVEVGPIGLRVD